MRLLFQRWDVDRDGLLGRDDFVAMIKAHAATQYAHDRRGEVLFKASAGEGARGGAVSHASLPELLRVLEASPWRLRAAIAEEETEEAACVHGRPLYPDTAPTSYALGSTLAPPSSSPSLSHTSSSPAPTCAPVEWATEGKEGARKTSARRAPSPKAHGRAQGRAAHARPNSRRPSPRAPRAPARAPRLQGRRRRRGGELSGQRSRHPRLPQQGDKDSTARWAARMSRGGGERGGLVDA